MADDPKIIAISHQRTLQTSVLALDGLELQRAFNQRHHLLRRERLFNVVESAALDGVDSDVDRAVRGHYDHFGVRRVVLYQSQQVDPAGVRKPQVSEDEIVWRTFEKLFRLAPAFGGVYVVAQIT